MKHTLTLATALFFLLTGCAGPRQVSLLYWNIQNGMWADQENNYDNFVRFVRETAPDICIWCEAKTHYRTGQNKSFPDDPDSPEFLTQDYLAGLPYLTDIQRERLDTFTGAGNRRRIDYLYATPPVVSRIKSFRVVRDGYPANRKAGVGKLWTPSDHYPLMLELGL